MAKRDIEKLKSISTLMDSKFEAFGFRFGLDALIGLVPIVGDWIGVLTSLYLISEAAKLGVGRATLVRMGINVAIENIVDMIPVLGNLFDFYWKANDRNMELLERHLKNPPYETIKSRTVVGLIILALVLLLLSTGYVTFIILEAFWQWITSLSTLQ